MKFWRTIQKQYTLEGIEKKSKKEAKMLSFMMMQGRVSPKPSSLLMGLTMPFQPIAIEGPTKDGFPLLVNPWAKL